jgi:hypothetical protein
LHVIVKRHTTTILEVGGSVTKLWEETSALTLAHQRTIRNRKRAYFELVRQTLEQFRGEGKVRVVNTTLASFSGLGMILWISRWYRHNGKLTLQQVLGNLQELASGAVLKTGSGRADRAEQPVPRNGDGSPGGEPQKLNRAPTWTARGPADPKVWLMRCVGWPKEGVAPLLSSVNE